MKGSVSIAVHGASGRMGQAILRLAARDARLRIGAALVQSGSELKNQPLRNTFGADAGDQAYTTALDAGTALAVLIDFSSAQAFDHALALALSRKLAFVSGTTGLSSMQRGALQDAAATIPVLWCA